MPDDNSTPGVLQIVNAVRHVVDGKTDVIVTALIVMIARGHLLIEDAPGVGKTMLARALAKSISGTVSRIQFTPDLLPSDITGVSIFDQSTREFEFRPGPVFANMVIADEINRASPKTQSALLEAMAERQVTVDGTTRALPQPFSVIATQNPHDMAGTYAIPEAQRDRFMARISIGYPSHDAEIMMMRRHSARDPVDDLRPVMELSDFAAISAAATRIHVSEPVESYIVALVHATRNHPEIAVGASPRATLQLVQAARARALLANRDFVLPDDVVALAPIVLPHRLLLAHATGLPAEDAAKANQLISQILTTLPVQTAERRAAPGR